MYRAFALCLLAFLVIGSFVLGGNTLRAHAQLDGSAPITLDVEPQYPVPYQTVTITPSSDVFDMSGASVSVTVNGKSFYTGTGGAAISVPLGGPGSVSDIVVNATTGGQTYSQEVVLHPASVAVVVEPVSTTHPFYEGAGLLTSDGRVRLIAIPDFRTSSGALIDPSTLEYTWKFGDQVLEEDSGIGDSVLDATAPQQYRDADVTVTVTDPNSTEIAQGEEDISPVSPVTLIYANDPLMGPLYDNALSGTVTMGAPEGTYRGVAYYFSETPDMTWEVNGNPSGTAQDITVRATGSGQGTAVLNFAANQSDDSLTANSTISVNFGQQQSSGVFGL